MNTDAIKKETADCSAARSEVQDSAGWLEEAALLWRELRALSYDHFRLVALETQRAGVSLVAMIEIGLIVAVLISSAWLGLMAAAVYSLIENGVETVSALLLGVASNLLLALILLVVIRRKSRYLHFPAILHTLQVTPAERQDAESS
jgi:hypothetical protein